MAVHQRKRVRCRIDLDKDGEFVDVSTNKTPIIWDEAGVQFEFGFFIQDAIADITNFDSVTMKVKMDTARDGAAIMEETLAGGSLNKTLTEAQWDAGILCHATLVFSSAEVPSPFGTNNEADYFIALGGTTSDDPSDKDFFGYSKLKVRRTGLTTGAQPAAPAGESYATISQVMALLGSNVIRHDNPAGVTAILRSPDGTKAVLLMVNNDGDFLPMPMQ